MARITLGGPDLRDFQGNGADQHVALYFYEPDVELPRPFTAAVARSLMPQIKPRLRRYTIRAHRPESAEVDMDFVLHGDDQLASGWAGRAKPGDELIWFGPTPAYPLRHDADWQLFIGDETALPAISVMLEELPPQENVLVCLEVADSAEEQPLPTSANARVRWVHRDDSPAATGSPLVSAVKDLRLPPGRGRVWAGAERAVIKQLRQHFIGDLGMDRHDTRLTTYWDRHHSQDTEL